MNIKDYVAKNILLLDGAMGTYYAELTHGNFTMSEPANLKNPDLIRQIHKEYIEAGAKLIRTNTFSANPFTLEKDMAYAERVIVAGIKIANEAAKGTDTSVAYSIGPIPEPYDVDNREIISTYHKMIDIALREGVQIILFETFSRLELVSDLVSYVKEQSSMIQVMTNFSLNQHGYTKVGILKEKIIEHNKEQSNLAAYGFNCGVGVSHLLKLIQTIDFDPETLIAVPNAGYPDQQMERTVYQNNAEFFAETMLRICEEGVRIVGGCCGTTPLHIKKLADRLATFDEKHILRSPLKSDSDVVNQPLENKFRQKLEANEFVIAVELDPPYKPNMQSLMSAAHLLQDVGVDVITIADSPLGRARADAMLMAAKIKQAIGMDVLPHMSLRDRNLIALRASLLGAHLFDVRNVLVVTGDPIPSDDRDEIKSVFNMNSINFMSYVSELNQGFGDDGFYMGGALNPYSANIDKTIERVLKKKASGAKYLMTQPVYNQQGIDNIIKIKEATGMKILGGIMPLVSLRNARFLHYEFPGITIPESVMNVFKEGMTREESEQVGVKVAIDIAREMKAHVDGFYFMTPFNRATMIEKVIRGL